MVKLSKQLPLVALLLAFTVFVGKAAVQALSTSSTTMWLYDPDEGNPDNPDAYTRADNDEQDDCEGDIEVCTVEAPEVNGKPDFDTDLETALREGTSHTAITLGPYSPQTN